MKNAPHNQIQIEAQASSNLKRLDHTALRTPALTVSVRRGSHVLDDRGEFLSLPREHFELPLCVLIGEREEFHWRLHVRQFCGCSTAALMLAFVNSRTLAL